MYYNQELGLCIEFGPVRDDSVRRGGGRALNAWRRYSGLYFIIMLCTLESHVCET